MDDATRAGLKGRLRLWRECGPDSLPRLLHAEFIVEHYLPRVLAEVKRRDKELDRLRRALRCG